MTSEANSTPGYDSGDAWNVEELLVHSAWIRAFARRLVGGDADDLVQDTWLAAVRRPPRRSGTARAWLASVARNLASNRRRGDARRDAREEFAGASREPLPSPDELLERSEQQRMVALVIQALREPYRSTLLLRYFEGIAPGEIATRLGIPAATVRVRIKRGTDLVREALDVRAQGDRSKWMSALAPIAGLGRRGGEVKTATMVAGGLAMTLGMKLTAAGLACAAALTWFALHDAPTSDAALEPIAGVVEVDSAPLDAAPEHAPREPVTTETPAAGATAIATVAPAEQEPPLGRVLLVDLDTKEPLRGFEIQVLTRLEERVEGLVVPATLEPVFARSDEDGFLLVAPDVVALLSKPGVDDDEEAARRLGRVRRRATDPIVIEWVNGAAVVEVRTGWTLRLALDLPVGVTESDLFATVGRRAPRFDFDPLTFVTRRGAETVAVFPPLWPGERNRELTVATFDGSHVGRATLPAAYSPLDLVHVAVRPAGVVRGRVVARSGELESEAEVSLFPGVVRREEIEAPALVWCWPLRAVRSPAFDFGALTPGVYTLLVEAKGYARHAQQVEVGAGAPTELEVLLEQEDLLDAVLRGEITSVSGTFERRMGVYARRAEGDSWLQPEHTDITWSVESGRKVGRFEFDELEQATYELGLHVYDEHTNPRQPGFRISPSTLAVTPGQVARFRVEDAEPLVNVEIRAVYADTKEPVEEFTVFLMIPDDPRSVAGGDGTEGVARLDGVSDLARRGVSIHSDDTRFLELPPGSLSAGAPNVLELARGWTGAVHAKGPDGPLAGASVLVDGTERGVTAEDGRLLVDLDAMPTRIEVVLAGWRITECKGVEPDGTLLAEHEDSGAWLPFTLEPAE